MERQNVRGIFVSATRTFAERNYTPEQVRKILAQLSPDLRSALPQIKPHDWYPLHFATDQLRGIYQCHTDPKEAVEAIVRCGMFVGDEATSTFLKLVIKMLTLSMLASKWQQFWGKYHDFGVCTADASRIAEKKFFVVAKPGYPYVHGIGAGWLRNVFSALGKQNVEVTTNVPLGEVDAPEIIWTTTWT
jgi:hypothetical protein